MHNTNHMCPLLRPSFYWMKHPFGFSKSSHSIICLPAWNSHLPLAKLLTWQLMSDDRDLSTTSEAFPFPHPFRQPAHRKFMIPPIPVLVKGSAVISFLRTTILRKIHSLSATTSSPEDTSEFLSHTHFLKVRARACPLYSILFTLGYKNKQTKNNPQTK